MSWENIIKPRVASGGMFCKGPKSVSWTSGGFPWGGGFSLGPGPGINLYLVETWGNQPVKSHPDQQGAAKGFPGECINFIGHSFLLNDTGKSPLLHCRGIGLTLIQSVRSI